ncbi:hypothetical protein [Klebsiella pneumoniae]|nr:hypothetical protein [Klebsiella pneumoniae]
MCSSSKGDDKFITTDYLQQCPTMHPDTLDDWNKTGLMSLCLLDGEKL